jgi:hypothetical protein
MKHWPALTLLCACAARVPSHAERVGNSQSPTASIPNWYFDPAGTLPCTSDNNSCTSATCGVSGVGPCQTWGGILARLGTKTPTLSIAVLFTELSDQVAPWVDPIVLRPDLVAPGGSATLTGSLVQVATATIGTFTPRVRGLAGQTTNHVTAVGQGGAYWTAFIGDLVHDTTANAWFWVERDLGTGVAQITEPVQSTLAHPIPPTYVTIANGDSLVITRPTTANVVSWSPSSQFALISGAIQHVTFSGGGIPQLGDFLPVEECAFGAANL